jgi:hypothetical protein
MASVSFPDHGLRKTVSTMDNLEAPTDDYRHLFAASAIEAERLRAAVNMRQLDLESTERGFICSDAFLSSQEAPPPADDSPIQSPRGDGDADFLALEPIEGPEAQERIVDPTPCVAQIQWKNPGRSSLWITFFNASGEATSQTQLSPENPLRGIKSLSDEWVAFSLTDDTESSQLHPMSELSGQKISISVQNRSISVKAIPARSFSPQPY